MEMHALIEEIAALFAKIKSGEATLGELEAFAAATNQLNERAIILRYKAHEAKVYGTPVSEKSPSEAPLAVKEEIVPIIEAQESHPEEQEEPSFDLFGMDTEEEETEDEIAFELIEDTMEEEEAIDEIVEPAHLHEDVAEEKEPVVSEPAFAAPIENTQGLHPIYGKLNSNDGTLAARLMSVRLETLKGAFGFNERLQIIQELFNGSNEEFNNLIEQLESIPSKEQARSLVSSYANKYHWDAESQLAIELIQKVERKYA
ncbi:MAG: hypothetical protein K0S23_3617 [Fluviicola sp.]|jgi:hypothetical protein|uniref:hypothetical protein n=1 Tax=Fluviicola sp. TaxID=1917219 RepID=UPI00263A0B88|nr:hypothetical protein [Fluviicola sp.]MDF3029310.1 hypothetical protein [Fluviicola sp.]